MKQRSDKEQQAYDILQKMPYIQLFEVEKKEEWKYSSLTFLCIINGRVFGLVSSLVVYSTSAILRKHLDAGEITPNEMIPVRAKGKNGGPSWLASIDVIMRFEEELLAQIGFGKESIKAKLQYVSTLLDNKKDVVEINSYTMTQEEINNAHFCYKEYYRLLKEAHEEANKKIAERQKESLFNVGNSTECATYQSINNEELTLKDLVARIEAMGWTVTLQRKDGASDNNEASNPAYITAPVVKVPSWYDDKTYQMLFKDLSCFHISEPTIRLLGTVNIKTLGQLVAMTRLDLLKIKQFGRKKLTELDDFLEELGLEFGCDLDKWHAANKAYEASK